jgi:hypothetical protein
MVSTITKMFGQGVAGRAAQQSYNAQAAQAELAGRSQAIQYKTQAANILRNLNETIATITARAGASGGVGGSAGALLRNVSGQGGADMQHQLTMQRWLWLGRKRKRPFTGIAARLQR